MTTADVILQQLGGNAFITLTGARDFLATGDGLQFSLPRKAGFVKFGINKVRIDLNFLDLYDVTFYRMKGLDFQLVSASECVDAANLRRVFTNHTGLETGL